MKKSKFYLISILVMVFFNYTGNLHGQNAYSRICLEAISYEQAGNLDEAVVKYGEAIKLKPEEWTGYNYRAKVNFHRGKYDEAISDITRAINLSPQTLSLYALRAGCYEEKGQYDRAIEDYNMALSKPGKNTGETYMIYFRRGRTYLSSNKFRESVSDFNKALDLSQKARESVPEIFEYRAQAYLALNSYPEAVADLDKVLSSKPDHVEALLLQGYAMLKNGEKEKAKVIASKLVQLDPAKGIFFSGSNLTDIFDIEMRRSKTLRLVNLSGELIEEQSSTPSKILAGMKLTDAFKNLDTAWLYSPAFTKEDISLRETILKNIFTVYPLLKTKPEIPEQVRKYAVQASGATQDRNYAEAVKLWSVVLDMAPYYQLAWYNRSLLYERAGQFGNSIADMEKYLQLVPDAPDARSSRDKIYEWEGKVKEVQVAGPAARTAAINEVESKSYSPGHFRVATAFGGSFGYQFSKNPGLADLWTQSTAGATPGYEYSDKMPFLYSGDAEITIKPVRMIGIGAFGKMSGGIGAHTKVGEVKYMLNMTTLNYGGFLRYYLLQNNGRAKPDVYIQYAYGRSNLTGLYGVATMDGIIYDYSYMKQLKSSAPFQSAGVGMGGKLGKSGYLTLSSDYMFTEFKEITYEVTIDKANPANVGSKGTVINSTTDLNTSAKYNGILIRLLFGICF